MNKQVTIQLESPMFEYISTKAAENNETVATFISNYIFPTCSLVEVKGVKALTTKKTAVLVIAESKPADEILLKYFLDISKTQNINAASSLATKASSANVTKAVRYIKMFALPNQQFNTLKPYVVIFFQLSQMGLGCL